MSDDDELSQPGRRRTASREALSLANGAAEIHALATKLSSELHAVAAKLASLAGKMDTYELNDCIQRLRRAMRDSGNAGDRAHEIRREIGAVIDKWLSSVSTPQ